MCFIPRRDNRNLSSFILTTVSLTIYQRDHLQDIELQGAINSDYNDVRVFNV